MMARYIVVEVENDALAAEMAKRLNKGNARWRVVGLFARPDNWCKCMMSSMGYGAHKDYVRGSKLGWWLHNIAGCGRPRFGTHQLENLLPVSKIRNSNPDQRWTVRVTSLSVAELLTQNLKK
jgi:hypothetical protein